jgi:hypothetical protein
MAIDPDLVQAGPIALLFVVGLGVALVLLLRSLNKHLKRVDFERPEAPGTGRDRAPGGAARPEDRPDGPDDGRPVP